MSNINKRITKSVLLAALIVMVSAAAQAEPFRGGFGGPRFGFRIGGFYDPFWGPYYPYGAYPYVVGHTSGRVRVEGVPKETEVYVDGYFAGTAGTIPTTPGGHAIALYLPGYRTITQHVYVRPGSTFKMKDTMEPLGPGEVSERPSAPAPRVDR
jgi:PEGA domain